MNDFERFKLLGTYKTPRVRIGTVLTCEARDCDVIVTRYSDARIPWPIGRKRGAPGWGGIVVYGDLATAIRNESNQSVSYWFGITLKIVTNWRRALGVGFTNAGTHKLRQGYGREDWFKEVQRKGAAKKPRP